MTYNFPFTYFLELIHSKHKPYEFSLKMLSGLAFQDYKSLNCIPLYLKDFRDILPEVPLFLVAGHSRGFKIPQQINNFLQAIKGCPIKSCVTDEDRVKFFSDRISKECQKFHNGSHEKCCKERCFQVSMFH